MAKQRVTDVHIKVAKNGWSVTCDYAPEHRRGGTLGLMGYQPTKPVVFNNLTELLDHVEDELEGSTEGSREERAEEKPKVRVLRQTIRHDKMRKAHA